jgi:acetyl esterase/lipase
MTTHVLVLPGGGYEMLAPHEGEPVAEWLRTLGLSASVFDYPLRARHPTPLEAVQAELARLRADGATTLGILGFSAGGHLAGHAALSGGSGPSRVDFGILCYPVVSMIEDEHAGSTANLLGPDPSDAERRAVSLDLLADETAPPLFLWHTADDEAVPVVPVYRLAAALSRHERPHAVHVFPHGRHGLGLSEENPVVAEWTGLAATWLREGGWR